MKKTVGFFLGIMLFFVLIAFPLAGQEKVTLRFWIHQHPPEVQFIQDVLIPEFKKTHPNVDVEFAFFPNKDYTPKIMVAQATGTVPDFFDLSDGFFLFISRKRFN